MFEEIAEVLLDFHERLDAVKRNVIFGGDYFHALALAEAYNNLILLTDERTQQHPEVQRVPSLRYILLQHFYENADRHINIQRGTIFDDALLGGPRTLKEWQDAGYHTRRSQANYDKRLRYWRAIYDNAPLTFQNQVQSQEDIFSAKRTYQSTFIAPLSKKERKGLAKPKVRIPGRVQRNGQDVTYEDVIRSRDARYGSSEQLVPWWRALNYGTGGQGYPVSTGLHFVEDAERAIPQYIDKYMAYFESFISDIIDNENISGDDIFTVESWAKAHVILGPEYIPSFDLARIKSFGVPF